MNSFLIIYKILLCVALVIFVLELSRYEAATRENLSSGFPTKRVSNQAPRLKIEVSLVAILDMTSKKQMTKLLMRLRLCCYKSRKTNFLSGSPIAIMSFYHEPLESKMRNLIFVKNDITQIELSKLKND